MSVEFLYSNSFGRFLLKGLISSKSLKVGEWFMKSPLSKPMIGPYIRRNHIPMKEFRGQSFNSFAEFFARRRDDIMVDRDPKKLISPCDSLLSIFPIEKDTRLHIKNSVYRIEDLISNRTLAESYAGGLCLIFRLRANDYHHFCYVDDCEHGPSHYIPGTLHSVQPIVCETVPVYRLNRRRWTLLNTKNFGPVTQIEVGAMLVGGMVHEKVKGVAKRGEEMGHFELAGSTIVLLLDHETRKKLRILPKYRRAKHGVHEIKVHQGTVIGVKDEEI